jgi:hypothetical protein
MSPLSTLVFDLLLYGLFYLLHLAAEINIAQAEHHGQCWIMRMKSRNLFIDRHSAC